MTGVVNGKVNIKDPKMMEEVIQTMLIQHFDADLDTMIDMQKRNNEKSAAGVTSLDDLPNPEADADKRHAQFLDALKE